MPDGGGPFEPSSPKRPTTASRRPGSARRARPGTARISRERTVAQAEQANPSPKVASKSKTKVHHVQESFNEAKLQAIANTDNLSGVTKLKVEVNTTESSLGRFGEYLPNLIDLDLRNSKISSIRDLGTTLGRITVLRLSNCGISDLSGVSTLAALKELSLAYNSISICSPLTMLSELETLNIQNNAIVLPDEVGYLGLCMQLVNLTLANNPFHASFECDAAKYTQAVMDAAPQLESLDERLELPPPPTKVVDADAVADAAADAAGTGRPGTAGSGGRRGSSASSQPTTAGSGGRPDTASRRAGRPGPDESSSGGGGGGGGSGGGSAAAKPDTTLFQGNPLKALRARKASRGVEEGKDPDAESLDALLASVGLGPADEYVEDYDGDTASLPPAIDKDSVFSDLRSWHSNYSRQSAAIESSGIGSYKAVVARVSLSGGKGAKSTTSKSTSKSSPARRANSKAGHNLQGSSERPPRGSRANASGSRIGRRGSDTAAAGVAATAPNKSGKGASDTTTQRSARPTPPRGSGTPPRGSGASGAMLPRGPRHQKHSPKPPGPSDSPGGQRSRTASGLRRQRLRSVDATSPDTPPHQSIRPPIRPASGPAELPTMTASRDVVPASGVA